MRFGGFGYTGGWLASAMSGMRLPVAFVLAGAVTAQALLQPLFNHAPDLPTPTIAQLMRDS